MPGSPPRCGSRCERGRRLTATNNRVVNNIFVDAARPIVFGDPSNTTDYNVYVTTLEGTAPPKAIGPHSVILRATFLIDAAWHLLDWRPASSLPPVPGVPGCDRDFAGVARAGETTVPGSTLSLAHPASVRLPQS